MTNITSSGSKAIRLAAALCCLCAISTPGRSAAFQARWNEIASLAAGQEATIPLPGGAVVTGDIVSVRADSLVLDVHRSFGGKDRYKGLVSIPRGSVTAFRATKMQGSWGRRIGVFVGQLSGLVLGGEFVGHVANSEAAGVPSFLAIDVGATLAGYFAGKVRDRRIVEIEVLPEPPSDGRTAEPRPSASLFAEPVPMLRRR